MAAPRSVVGLMPTENPALVGDLTTHGVRQQARFDERRPEFVEGLRARWGARTSYFFFLLGM
jgi:hypothetical protein